MKIQILSKGMIAGLVVLLLSGCAGRPKVIEAAGQENVARSENLITRPEAAAKEEKQDDGMKHDVGEEDLPDSTEQEQAEQDQVMLFSSTQNEAMVSHLKIASNRSWYQDPTYTITDNHIEQVIFHDTVTDSQAIFRAGTGALDEISGIYYVFDDTLAQTWTAVMDDSAEIVITIQLAIENSDVHGALASWKDNGRQYTLWEDRGRENPAAVAAMAKELAKQNYQREEYRGTEDEE